MSTEAKKYRLITRSDFDGLVCAVLLQHLDMIDDILFVHPKDMQDMKVPVNANDITTNLPYVPGVYLAFDHHLSETIRNTGERSNHVIFPDAPSAARVVYDYYGGRRVFPASWDDMMAAVDKGDSARFNEQEILDPKGWDLLNFIMDARTGLGRFREFRISNYQLMMELIHHCRSKSIHQLMELPDVQERVNLYLDHEAKSKEQIRRCTTVHGQLAVLDLRNEEIIYASNRFIIYALFPETTISIHVLWGLRQQNTVFATGKSIINRSSATNIGELMLEYHGGGHENAGTCQVPNDDSERVLGELIARITAE